jgi:SecD/SecF fusion protein
VLILWVDVLSKLDLIKKLKLEISSLLTKAFGTNVEAKTFGTGNQLKITTKYKVAEEGEGVDKEVNQKLYDGLKSYFPNTSYDEFVTNYDGKRIGCFTSN